MSHSRRVLRLVPLLAPLSLLPGAELTAGQGEGAPSSPPAFEERLEVTLVTTTLFAVDEAGQPVRDLRPEEIEVTVGGKATPLAFLEPPGAAVAAPPARIAGSPGPPPAAASQRHVFLFFDQAFSTARGLDASRRAARELVDRLPAGDWLYLVTFHTQRGFEQELGPVVDAAGRQHLLSRIGELRPNVERVRRVANVVPLPSGKRSGSPAEDAMAELEHMELANYRAEGSSLASALATFAAFLRQLPGSKVVLYFTQGIDSRVYQGGMWSGHRLDRVTGTGRVGAQNDVRLQPLRLELEPALEALADSGALVMFVNPLVGPTAGDQGWAPGVDSVESPNLANDVPTGDTTLAMMTATSGGMLVRDPNLDTLQRRVEGWVGAAYQLGVYLPANSPAASLPLSVAVGRPGVRTWSPRSLQPPRRLADLPPDERAFLAGTLVLQHDPGGVLRNVSTAPLQPLRGRPEQLREGDRTRLRLQPDWPAELLVQGLEVYVVAIEAGPAPRLLALEKRLFTPTPGGVPIEAVVPAREPLLWGVVAFDLTAGSAYLGRFRPDRADRPAPAPGAGEPRPQR